MTARELQQWPKTLTQLLESGETEAAIQHALSFPTPGYRIRLLLRASKQLTNHESIQRVLTLARTEIASLSQPQAQSHAWGWLCRAYAKHHFLHEAGECALLVSDPYARKVHLSYVIQLYRYERRYTEALRLCETWREVAEPHERSLIETLVALLDLPLEKKRRKHKSPPPPPQPLDIDPALLKAIVAARGEKQTDKAVLALIDARRREFQRPLGSMDSVLFQNAMRHALRWLPAGTFWRRALLQLCLEQKELELAMCFDDALLKAARAESDPARRYHALNGQLVFARRHKSTDALNEQLAELRATIRSIPNPRQREHAFTFLGCHLYWLGWRGKRLGWENKNKEP